MKKTLALCLALLPTWCSAAGPVSEAPDAFRSLSEFKPVFVSKPLPKPGALTLADVSGNLDLSGNVYVSNDNGYVSVTLHGWADVWDATGKIRSGSTAVDFTKTILVSNGWIDEQINPSYDIEVSKDGRNAGLAHVSADIFLSGHVSNHFVYLTARAPLSGSVDVQE